MSKTPKILCMWPGLPELWGRGSWSAVILALGFTLLINIVLVSSLVWTSWLDPALRLAGWLAVVSLWVAAAWNARRTAAEPGEDSLREQWFAEAQSHYLRGEWYEAETLLCRLAGRKGHDVDALVMLATLKRHTGRLDEAEALLEQLIHRDDARDWQRELLAEQALVARDRVETLEEAEASVDETLEAGELEISDEVAKDSVQQDLKQQKSTKAA